MRHPSAAGRFYPSDPDDLRLSVESCFRHPLGPGVPVGSGCGRSIRAAMVPHAGYMASGMNAANVYASILSDGLPSTYVVIGPDHHGMAGDTVLCSEPFATPLGICRTDTGLIGELSGYFPDRPDAHALEHSVEVQVPFIQFIDPDPRIVPIMMGDQSPDAARELSDVLREVCDGRDVVVIASTDMSHYVPKSVARDQDLAVLDRILDMDVGGMYGVVRDRRVSMCGYGPVAAAMWFCGEGSAELLRYSDSFDSLGYDPGSVVGYASVLFR
ncbi:MAG: AmmeMemoRadiSam system protein B [Candidatus Methanomethylophilaceae archaeon]|nr:AmmeMemoRadiSam system protein B [Candidatus Methanomethylophilaceae archaeon]